MTDDRHGAAAPASEADTAQPNPPEKRADGWEMPEPKFQQTSGYLPQGYLDQAGLAAAPAPAQTASPVTSPDVEAPAEAVSVEPQPDLDIGEPFMTPAAPLPAVKQRSTGARVGMILLGVVGMIAFIAIFLAVIYYLFIRRANGGGPF